MIGVIAGCAEREVVREFFELFKTPWEFYRADRSYDVLLCVGESDFDESAKLVILYSAARIKDDEQGGNDTSCDRKAGRVAITPDGRRLPIYEDSITFAGTTGIVLLKDGASQECVAYLREGPECCVARVGYDLFREIRKLLAEGQPITNAGTPALEVHIAFLRQVIISRGIRLVEIPPVPGGHQFIACLTHDVDHPSIRRHKLDRTVLGFLYRAALGSLRDFIRGRIPFHKLVANWLAALKLPLVALGLLKDFWRDFDSQYGQVEKYRRSTFFVIPFEGNPGRTSRGFAPSFRAARYGARHLADTIQKLINRGCEVGLHGIDAWLDSSAGRKELEEIRRLTGVTETGVRMHWLYYNARSAGILEEAGAAYDSTVGYNEAIGYRAGTTQVYKPLEANRLLELPLHAMDTALFYPSRLGLSMRKAQEGLNRLVDDAVEFGGCLTFNWHDRSLAPERLWDACYSALLERLEETGAWFATASEAVAWFKKRRSAVFETESTEVDCVRIRPASTENNGLPPLQLRVYNARQAEGVGAKPEGQYVQTELSTQASRDLVYFAEDDTQSSNQHSRYQAGRVGV